jgi:hypothetical protein
VKKPINNLDSHLKLIKRLREIHLEAFSSFTAFETIQELRAPNHVGQDEAHANAEAIGNYRYFFNIAIRALNYDFLMLVSILFIDDKQSISLPKILRIIEQNPTTVKDYSELNSTIAEDRLSEYEGLKPTDLKMLRVKLDEVSPIVSALKKQRDKILAHRDINAIVPEQITYEDIYKLMEIADYFLNYLTQKLNRATTSYMLIKPETISQTKLLVEVLRKQDAEDYNSGITT